MKVYMLSIALKARKRWTPGVHIVPTERATIRLDGAVISFWNPTSRSTRLSSLGGILPAAPFHAAAAFGELTKLFGRSQSKCMRKTALRTFWPS